MNRNRLIIAALLVAVVLIALIVMQRNRTDEDPVATSQPSPPRAVIEEAVNLLSKAGVAVNPAGLFEFPGDWRNIPTREITLFYPGQASWQWLTSEAHAGRADLLAGTPCSTCHQESRLGEALVNHAILEGDPIAGKTATITVNIKAAFDDRFFYLRADYPAAEPGITHTLWRFNGSDWEAFGGPKPDVTHKNLPPSYEDRFTMILADRNIPAFAEAGVGFADAGCFITCHNSMRRMPLEPSSGEVQAHPYLGGGGLKSSDVRKYLLLTRTELDNTGGWNRVKPVAELERLMAEGMFLDLWQARASRSLPVGYASDDFVFEYRKTDAGRSPFTTPGKPSYMYDRAVVGFNAINESEFQAKVDRFPLIIGKTAVPITDDAEFQEGDILPRVVLRTPEGSGADVLVNGTYRDGRWIMEIRRALNTGNDDDKTLAAGEVYNVGMAIFDDNVSNRRHHVSFVKTLGLGVDADITAQRLE